MNFISLKVNLNKEFKGIVLHFTVLYIINLLYHIFMYYWSIKNENGSAMLFMMPWIGVVFVIVSVALYQKFFKDVGFKYYLQLYVFLTTAFYGVLRILVMILNTMFFSDVYFWGEGEVHVIATLVELFDTINFVFIIYSVFHLLVLWVLSAKRYRKKLDA